MKSFLSRLVLVVMLLALLVIVVLGISKMKETKHWAIEMDMVEPVVVGRISPKGAVQLATLPITSIVSARRSAQEKAEFITAKSSVSMIRATAEVVWQRDGNGYTTVCDDPLVRSRIASAEEKYGPGSVVCDDTFDGYAVELVTGGDESQYFCIDSRGSVEEGSGVGIKRGIQCDVSDLEPVSAWHGNAVEM